MNRIALTAAVASVMVLRLAAPVTAQQVVGDVKLFADEEIKIKAPAKIEQPI